LDYIKFGGWNLGEFNVKGIIILNEYYAILITAISWHRIRCYLQNAGGFIEQLCRYQLF
jgi:hypothetical protein